MAFNRDFTRWACLSDDRVWLNGASVTLDNLNIKGGPKFLDDGRLEFFASRLERDGKAQKETFYRVTSP